MISFIVPAYNEERLLGRTLGAIRAAVDPLREPYEIVVADDNSADRTAAIAQENGARVVRVANRQIAATRNAGAREARGDLFIFVDADTVVNEAVVRGAVGAMRNGAVGGGSAVEFDGVIPAWARLLTHAAVYLFRIARLSAGCFLFCTRAGFEQAGGFNETLFGGEEVFMSQALKKHGRFVVLRESVLSSGRKLRAHSGRELLRLCGAIAIRGPGAVRQRQNLGIWYGERREDPNPPA